jgi:hypothetical protein
MVEFDVPLLNFFFSSLYFAYFIYDGPLLLACEGISEEVKTQCHSG